MTKHSINTVLRASTAKVQTVYRGKYPSRLRFISIGKGETHITSNDHRVLHVVGEDHRALVRALNHQLPTLADTIEVLAQHVADYRNAMAAGRKAGPVASRIAASINRECGPLSSCDVGLRDAEQGYRVAVIVALTPLAVREAGMNAPYSSLGERYNRARNAAHEAGKTDARVTICQIYNLTGINIYKAKPVKIGPVARAVMSAIDHCLSFGSARPDWVLMNREQSSSAFNVTAMAEAAGVDCLTTAAGNIVSRCDDAQRADESVTVNQTLWLRCSARQRPAACRLGNVEGALAWAFLQGYTGAATACEEYAESAGCVATFHDGGMYSDYVRFTSK